MSGRAYSTRCQRTGSSEHRAGRRVGWALFAVTFPVVNGCIPVIPPNLHALKLCTPFSHLNTAPVVGGLSATIIYLANLKRILAGSLLLRNSGHQQADSMYISGFFEGRKRHRGTWKGTSHIKLYSTLA